MDGVEGIVDGVEGNVDGAVGVRGGSDTVHVFHHTRITSLFLSCYGTNKALETIFRK